MFLLRRLTQFQASESGGLIYITVFDTRRGTGLRWGMDRILGTFMLLAAAAIAGAQTIPVEVVSADQSGQTITVRPPARLNVATTSTPEDTSIVTLSVLTSAVPALRSVRNGQEVTITCASTGAGGTTGGSLPGTVAGSGTGTSGGTAAGATSSATSRPTSGSLPGTAAGGSSGTMGGTAAGATGGTMGGTAAGNVSGTLGGNAAGGAATPRPSVGSSAGTTATTAASAATSTAATSTAAPTAPLPGATVTGAGTHDATVRPLSALQGSCSVAAIR
jgi:hypothetical protein